MRFPLALLFVFVALSLGQAEERPLFGLSEIRREATEGTTPMTLSYRGQSTTYQVEKEMVLTDQDVIGANVVDQESEIALEILLNKRGAKAFEDLTRRTMENRGQVAILVEGKLISAPSVRAVITGGTLQVIGDFSREDAVRIAGSINAAWKRRGVEKPSR